MYLSSLAYMITLDCTHSTYINVLPKHGEDNIARLPTLRTYICCKQAITSMEL